MTIDRYRPPQTPLEEAEAAVADLKEDLGELLARARAVNGGFGRCRSLSNAITRMEEGWLWLTSTEGEYKEMKR